MSGEFYLGIFYVGRILFSENLCRDFLSCGIICMWGFFLNRDFYLGRILFRENLCRDFFI